MLQIRMTDGDGSNPVILDRASAITYTKTINTNNDAVTFTLAKNDPKADEVNPYIESNYVRLWEVWETRTNRRLNFGPLTSITDGGTDWQVQGAGRSALLADYFMTLRTFNMGIDQIVEELRFENIAAAPTTNVYVTDDMNGFDPLLPSVIDDRFHSLSKNSAYYVVDGDTGYLPYGQTDHTRNAYYTTNQYWTGMGIEDSLLIDFNDSYRISKLRYLLPWWGGPESVNNRTYDFSIAYANAGTVYSGYMGGDMIGATTHIYYTGEDNQITTTPLYPMEFYIGATLSGTGKNLNSIYLTDTVNWGVGDPPSTPISGPIDMRYLITTIGNVHAWYGTEFDSKAAYDAWDYQCDPDYSPGDNPNIPTLKGRMAGKSFQDTNYLGIKPENDCHASVVEIGAYREIMEAKSVKGLALQRIDDSSMQIEYSRTPDSGETTAYLSGGLWFRKFEPGTIFSRFTVEWSNGINAQHKKFYATDCTNCYPDGFNFGILDDDSNAIFLTDDLSGTAVVDARERTRSILLKGGYPATVTAVNSWLGKIDQASYGGSYSYVETAGATAVVHFRGESFKWYSTVPQGKTGATAKVEIRNKINGDRKGPANVTAVMWSDWTTLEDSLQLPSNIANEVVYEIKYEDHYLEPETVYEIRITSLDDGFCGIDCFEGYWSASYVDYNEDSSRITLSKPEAFTTINDERFTNGSMYRWNTKGAGVSFYFEGDRIVVKSAKGRNHGVLSMLLYQYEAGVIEYDPGTDNHVFIPGGNSDGSLTVNLGTYPSGKGAEYPSVVIFDSNDYFEEVGLPWGKYTLIVSLPSVTTYTTDKNDTGMDSFQVRCKNCSPKLSGKTIKINKYVYLDGVGTHERVGISSDFQTKAHLDILTSLAEAIQCEWDVAVDGIVLEPRIGLDKDIILREGDNTVVSYQIVSDISKVATRLLSFGAQLSGADQFTVVDSIKSKRKFKRTITRQNDYRDTSDSYELIGLARTELERRNKPELRITVNHISDTLDLSAGDSFILWTRKSGKIRVRINSIQISEQSGREYSMECVQWPTIISIN